MSTEAKEKTRSPKDKYILFCFLAFFSVIFTVDGFFIYKALNTYTGTITDHAYEKGVEYNQVLEEAKNQPDLNDKASFKNNILRWDLGVQNAEVSAYIIRPIQEGHDFKVELENNGDGVYQIALDLPFKGLWEAKLQSQWNNQTYKTTHKFIQK